ncbi:MAG: hypothetical protein SVY15_05790 [Halobacteriota archaeon]|nr:hypothetical protein [Halobacteriota archaeon]
MVTLLLSSVSVTVADKMSDVTSWVDGGEVPQPQVMVSGYSVNPVMLMPGDEAILTVTLENTQITPVTNWIRHLRVEPYVDNVRTDSTIDAYTTKVLTMDAYVKEAKIVKNGLFDGSSVKSFNEYSKVGVIGPGKDLDLNFKIEVPNEVGIYMVNFYADIGDVDGGSSKSINYQIPIIVSSTVELIPVNVPNVLEKGSVIEIEVANTGRGDAGSIVVVSSVDDVTLKASKVYIGNLKAGESKVIEFVVDDVQSEGEEEIVLKALYKNGINEHESEALHLDVYLKGETISTGSPRWLFGMLENILMIFS